MELDFVWYYANPTSPFVKKIADDKERAHMVYAHVFKGDHYDEGVQAEYRTLRFPEEIRAAIERMRSFRPDKRYRARKALDKTYSNYLRILEANLLGLPGTEEDEEDFEFDEEDLDGNQDQEKSKKALTMQYEKWVVAAGKVREEMPKLLRDMEQGFGVVQSKVVDDDMLEIDLFIELQRQNNQ